MNKIIIVTEKTHFDLLKIKLDMRSEDNRVTKMAQVIALLVKYYEEKKGVS